MKDWCEHNVNYERFCKKCDYEMRYKEETSTQSEAFKIHLAKLRKEIKAEEGTETTAKSIKEADSRCFVATAAFGSPLAPEVVLLSNFRDEVLLNSVFGRAFVKFYYFVSPPLASTIAKTGFLRTATRRVFLAPILRLLKVAKFDS